MNAAMKSGLSSSFMFGHLVVHLFWFLFQKFLLHLAVMPFIIISGEMLKSMQAAQRVVDSHWMNQALQIALFRRILSLHSNRRPLKDFHLGETILPLQNKNTIVVLWLIYF